jgi:hypothetical protein
MNARLAAIAVVVLTIAKTASAHRLDEYLQSTFISLWGDSVSGEMLLTPGVAVLPTVLRAIDTNADGINSEAEQRVYAEQVLRDLVVTINGEHLRPRLVSVDFPKNEDLKEGLGSIHLEFKLELPRNVFNRHLRIENFHQPQISAYLVNCLMPANGAVRITSERRNYSQSLYEVEYNEGVISPSIQVSAWRLALPIALIAASLSVLALLIRTKRTSFLSRILAEVPDNKSGA